MPACPRCRRHDKVYCWSDYLHTADGAALRDAGDVDRNLNDVDRDDALNALLTGYIMERTKFCTFRPIGSNINHICEYKH